MFRKYLCSLFIFLTLFSGCFSKKNKTDANTEKFSKLGVAMKIPDNFLALPQDILENIETLGATVLDVEPFNVNPLYAYADNSGKGIIVVSELKFQEDITPERYALNNLNIYRNNLENYFAAGEISSEEMGNDDITTVLMAMAFQEEDDDIFLFKGLNYKYPNLFFMIDLYVINKEISKDDVFGYINMFNSLAVY